MSKKWMAINALLFIVACLLGWWLHTSIRKFNAQNNLETLRPKQTLKQKIAQENALPQLPPQNRYNPGDFSVISEKDLFSESRTRDEQATADSALPEAPPLSQKPILVGINIMGAQKTALLVDPKPSSQNRKRKAEIKRIGDVFQGHTITDIAPDHIVLESGSRKEIIPLHEGSKQTPNGRTPILSTRVVSFDGGAVSGGTPIVSSASSVSAARPTAVPVGTPESASQPKAAPVATISAAPAREPSREPAAAASPPQRGQSQQQSPSTGSSASKTRVIRTPFGDIVRPVRD